MDNNGTQDWAADYDGDVMPTEITYMDTEDEYKYMVSKIHIFKVHIFKLHILYLEIIKIHISNPFLGFRFLPWACLISLSQKS